MSDINHQLAEVAAPIANKITAAATIGVVSFSTLTMTDWGIISGIVLGAISLLVNTLITWHFNNKRLEIEKARLESQVAFTHANIKPIRDDEPTLSGDL